MRHQRVTDEEFRRMVRAGQVVDGASVAAYGLLLLSDD